MSYKHSDLSRIAFIAVAVFCAIAAVPDVSYCGSSSLFLVGTGYQDRYANQTVPPRIYELAADSSILREVWSPATGSVTDWISVVAPARCLLIQETTDQQKGRVYVFRMDDVAGAEKIETITPGARSDFRVYQSKTSPNSFAVDVGSGVGTSSRRFVPIAGSQVLDDSVWTNQRELVLSGPAPEHAGGDSDVIGLREKSPGKLYCTDPGVSVDIPQIPPGVIQSESTRGWVLIAQDSSFQAIMSLPDSHELQERELLIYDKTDSAWRSIQMPGSQTAPRLTNHWLVGVVANIDPRTDYQRMKGYYPTLTEASVIISPTNRTVQTVSLGKNSEILWISDDLSVYYRSEKSLFKAKLTDHGLIDRRQILQDRAVWFIHWAFEGQLGGSIPEAQ